MTSAIIQQPYGVVFAKEHMYAPFIICGGYLGFIYLFSNYMKYNVSFSLKQPLIYWNTSLCIFSFVGALQTIPLLFHLIYNSNDFKDTICENPSQSWGQNPWVGLFVYSKIPELIDTFFKMSEEGWLNFIEVSLKDLDEKSEAYFKKDSRGETTFYVENLEGRAKITLFYKDSPFYKPEDTSHPWKVEAVIIFNSKKSIEKYGQLLTKITNDELHEIFLKNTPLCSYYILSHILKRHANIEENIHGMKKLLYKA